MNAHEDTSGKPMRKRDKGGERSAPRDIARDNPRDAGRDHAAPASRKSSGAASARAASSKSTARAPASPIQALRAAVKKAAAKGKGKRRR